MNLNSLNIKLILGTAYLAAILIGLYFLFSAVDIQDLTSYEFIRLNKDHLSEVRTLDDKIIKKSLRFKH